MSPFDAFRNREVTGCALTQQTSRGLCGLTMRLGFFGVAACVIFAASGCSGTSAPSGFDGSGDDGGAAVSGRDGSIGALGDGGDNSGNGKGTLGSGDSDGGSSSGDAGPTIVSLYAHTDTTLYSLDPKNVGAEVSLGDFDCIGSSKSASSTSMTDLAVSATGQLYGVSEVAVYPLTVTSSGVHCAAVWKLPSGSKFYGLTMAPANTVDTDEVLIAANAAGELYKVNADTGATTQVGTFGTDPQTKKPWQLSGDIVFLANGGSPEGFATVRVCSSTSCTSTTDTLIEVDVSKVQPGTQSVTKAVRGAVTTGSWCTVSGAPSSYPELYGIVAYEDQVYGFSRTGLVVQMHNDDATACPVSSATNRSWAGAGVTTSAPVVVPPPIR